jgi:hypothetical protein
MLARLGAMQRNCGHFAEAHQNLALARELCREHLPADHPLTAQLGAYQWLTLLQEYLVVALMEHSR